MFKKLFFIALFAGPVIGFFQVDMTKSWQRNHEVSVGVAQEAAKEPQALVQIYQARDFKWKGAVSVRTWIATKERHSRSYVVYEIEGWNQPSGKSVLSVTRKDPDHTWFGKAPKLIYELKGEMAVRAIEQIDKIAKRYPYTHEYESWFGPNDNTFVAHVVRNVDELHFAMPPNAVGKDYLVGEKLYDCTPSKSGYQVNYRGMFGFMISRDEGFELNLGGLVIGVNPSEKEIKLPGFGAIGFKDVKFK